MYPLYPLPFWLLFFVEVQVMIVHQWDSKAHSCRNHHVHYFHPPLLGHPWSQDEIARWEDILQYIATIHRQVLLILWFSFLDEKKESKHLQYDLQKSSNISLCTISLYHTFAFYQEKLMSLFFSFCQNICQPAGEKVCGLAGEQLFANSKAAWGCQTKKRR